MRTFTLLGVFCLTFGLLKASKVDWLEGSGDDEEEEGSGSFDDEEEEEELDLVPDEELMEDEYYYDYPDEETKLDFNDYDKVLESYDADEDYEEYDYTKDEDDSVLKIQPDIEIKPRPESGEETFVLETSQLLIMIGSAFVSFGVVMLVFFTCRRSMQQKARKAAEVQKIRQGPIVKSYHRVPGSTLQYLEASQIDMYRGEQGRQGQPLIE